MLKSHSLRNAWIEMLCLLDQRYANFCRIPCGMRGLKIPSSETVNRQSNFCGMRIEIPAIAHVRVSSHSPAGRGLKSIHRRNHQDGPDSCRNAWIEIKGRRIKSLRLRMRGLKSVTLGFGPSIGRRIPCGMRGLKLPRKIMVPGANMVAFPAECVD